MLRKQHKKCATILWLIHNRPAKLLKAVALFLISGKTMLYIVICSIVAHRAEVLLAWETKDLFGFVISHLVASRTM